MNDLLQCLMAKTGMMYFDAADEGGSNAGGGGDAGTDDTNSGGEGGDTNAGGEDDKSKDGSDANEGADTILGGGTGKTEDNADGGEEGKSGEGDGKGENEGGDAEDDPVPEDGKYEFKFPEGVTPDEGLIADAKAAFAELRLGSKAAAKLVETYTGAFQRAQQAQVEAHAEQVQKWDAASKADKEFGGDAFKQSAAQANAALQKFGTPELTQVLQATGLANHPEMVRFMYRIGATMGEDTTVTGDPSHKTDATTEQSWYGNTTPAAKVR